MSDLTERLLDVLRPLPPTALGTSWQNNRLNDQHAAVIYEAVEYIEELEAALPLLVASPSLAERADIARRALENNDE